MKDDSPFLRQRQARPVGNIPIIGESRQQRRAVARQAGADIEVLTEQYNQALLQLHYRINVAFECMSLMGLTPEMVDKARDNIFAADTEVKEGENDPKIQAGPV